MHKIDFMYTVMMGKATGNSWPYIIIAVDLHGVLIDSVKYNKAISMGTDVMQAIEESVYKECLKPLQIMSIRNDIKLFLYTSTKKDVRQLVGEAFDDLFNIKFDYLNSDNLNLEPTRPSQDFNEKPYCDILLDNTAGFDPFVDWNALEAVINDYYIILKHGDSSRNNN